MYIEDVPLVELYIEDVPTSGGVYASCILKMYM